ncbi:hypothetical protein Angca_001253, partial [Angiostrongylus cantonensis]
MLNHLEFSHSSNSRKASHLHKHFSTLICYEIHSKCKTENMQSILLSTFVVFTFTSARSNRFMDDRTLIRERRQTYYLCGVYPNQYYSTTPCLVPAVCSNGGRYLGVGCVSSAQCTPFYSGISTCISGCCCTVPTTQPSNRFGYCPSRQLSEVRCSGRGQCQPGEICMTGLCCTKTGNEWSQACGGLAALGSCLNGSCSAGVCTASNYCCECPVGRSGGRCRNVGYTCL